MVIFSIRRIKPMYRVFVAQNRGRGLHIDFSQNVLQSINLLNRKMEKRKKKDRWRLIWFSASFHRADAVRAKQELDRVNSYEAMKAVMKKFAECERDADEESANLTSKSAPTIAA